MTYEEAISSTVTAEEARREVEAHGHEWAELTADLGEHDEYSGAAILAWLGY